MLTGKSPIELIDKAVNGGFKFDDIKRKFWEKSGEASEDAQTYIVNPLTVTALVGNNKISDLTNTIDAKTFNFREYDLLLKTAIESENTDMQILLQKVAKEALVKVINDIKAKEENILSAFLALFLTNEVRKKSKLNNSSIRAPIKSDIPFTLSYIFFTI